MSNLGPQNINQSYGYLLQTPLGLNGSMTQVTDGAGTGSGLYLDSNLNVASNNVWIYGTVDTPTSIVPFELGVLNSGSCFINCQDPLLFYQAGAPVLQLTNAGHLLINSPGADVSFLTVNGDTTTNACWMSAPSTEAYTSFYYGILIDYNQSLSLGQISLGTSDSLAIYAGGYANGTPVVSVTSTGINSTAIGTNIASTGAFTTLTASSSVSGTGFTSLFASPPAIGGTTPASGSFTSLTATSVGTSGVLAKNGGLTAVTAVAGSLTLATGGVTLAAQTMAAGSVWRVVAYGTYAAITSSNLRQFTISCFWGSTALTAVTTGNVLTTANTTLWSVEFEISGSSATAAWITGQLKANVGATAGVALLTYLVTPTSVTGLTTTSTLDFRVGQTGTATAGDTINVHSVTMERIK